MRKWTLWSDKTCVLTRFHCVKNANTQLIWSSVNVLSFTCFYSVKQILSTFFVYLFYNQTVFWGLTSQATLLFVPSLSPLTVNVFISIYVFNMSSNNLSSTECAFRDCSDDNYLCDVKLIVENKPLFTNPTTIRSRPVTLFTRDADWHKLVADLFYDFVSILLVWVAKCKMPSNWKISVT
jgi:hypothetical protein